jgi:hypothetical protein
MVRARIVRWDEHYAGHTTQSSLERTDYRLLRTGIVLLGDERIVIGAARVVTNVSFRGRACCATICAGDALATTGSRNHRSHRRSRNQPHNQVDIAATIAANFASTALPFKEPVRCYAARSGASPRHIPPEHPNGLGTTPRPLSLAEACKSRPLPPAPSPISGEGEILLQAGAPACKIPIPPPRSRGGGGVYGNCPLAARERMCGSA